MKKQLLIILSVFFFAINPVCFAKTITIDSVNYNVEANNILKKDNFTYDPNQDLLTLYNANLKTIHTKENLNIVLEGENTFINDNIGTTIKAKNLEIKGKGNLKITSLGKGLEIAKFTLTNTNLSIDSQDVGIVASSYDVIINNSTLEINSCEDAFRIIEKNLYLNNSKLKINSKFLIGDFGKDIYVNNSNLNLKLQYGIRSSLIYLLYVNGNSNLFLETINSNNKFLVNNLVLDNNLKLLGSLDNKNYEEKFDYEKTKYIQIITLNDYQLNIKEEELKSKEKELDNIKQQMIEKEEELKSKEKELDNIKQQIIKKEEELINYETILKNKENFIVLETKKIEEEKLKIVNLQLLLKKKEEELNDIETNCQNIPLSTNNIKNPQTHDSLTSFIILLFLSLIGFSIIIYLKRRKLKYANI